MAFSLGTIPAVIGGVTRNLLCAFDSNANVAAHAHMRVTSSGVEIGAPLAYASPTSSVSVGTSSGSLVAAGAFSNTLVLQTAPSATGNVWLNLNGGTAVVGQGLFIAAYGGLLTFSRTGPLPPPSSGISAISDSGTVNVSIQGG